MLIKKYVVNNITEGIAQIKMELGNDVIIVSHRKIRQQGLGGYFLPKQIEITVAYENKIQTSYKSKDDFHKENTERQRVSSAERHYKVKEKEQDTATNNAIIKEVSDMKTMLNKLVNTSMDNSIQNKVSFPNCIKFLEDKDIPQEFITKMSERFKDEGLEDDNIDIEKLTSILVESIEFDLCDCDELEDGIVAFVGPTGVGKTTTIAKLAGKYSLEYKKKVGLITVDTYRIGAIEQLKTYAEIMGIPFQVVFNIKEMEHAIESMKECDLIFLDTTGRSSKNLMQLQELRAYVKKAKPNKVFLMLSATTKNKDINAIIEGYRVMEYDNLIVSKLDETTTYGSLLSIIKNSKVTLSYITTGQGVPQDIKQIKDEQLIQLVLGETTIC